VRAFAAYGLGLLAYADKETCKEVGATLRDLLADDSAAWKDVRVAAAISLGLFDDPENQTLPALEKFFDNPENDSLVRAHTPVSIAKILNLKGDPQQEVEKFVQKFRQALETRKEDDRVKESCVIALGLLTNSNSGHYGAVLASLANQVQDGREQARNFAAIALAEMGGADAVTLLRRNLARGKSTFQPWAGLGLGVLCNRARTGKQEIPDREGILEDLRQAMIGEGSAEFAACYALALGLARDTSAREAIVKKMERISEEDSRGYFCLALGLLGSSESVDLLHREVKDSIRKPNLLKQAAIGLGLLSDRNAVPELLKILKEEKTLAVQAAVATALGFIGDSRSIDDLVAMMKDASLTDFARGFAAVALGIIADKETLPWNSKIAVSVNYRAFVRTLVGAGLSPGILDIL
jgi:HEAT repeat protein